MENVNFKAYVTKYALTTGIDVVDANLSTASDTIICYRPPGSIFKMSAHGKDWYRTPEAAYARAEEMRSKNYASNASSRTERAVCWQIFV